MKNVKNNFGFSLIEILLMVTLFAIILSSTVSLVGNKTTKEDINAKAIQLIDFIARAHDYSMSGYQGDVWGIKVLDNDAACENNGDCIVLFKSRQYSTRNASYDRIMNFDTGVYIDEDQENEFYFGYMSGWLSMGTSTTSTQSIILNGVDGETREVWITSAGLISSYYCGDNICNVEVEDCSSCSTDCSACLNSSPIVSDSNRAPLDEATNVPISTILWTWDHWTDPDGDTVEYFATIYNGFACIGSVKDTFGWDINYGFIPVTLSYSTNYSWQIKGRSQGISPTDETGYNTCYNLTTESEF